MDKSQGKKAAPKSGNPRIITMDSLRNAQQDERPAYFAGGSEHSGQQILGRSRRREEDSGEALAEAFRRASSNRNNVSSEPRIVSFREGQQSFIGVGHRLGDTETSPSEASNNDTPQTPQSGSTSVPGHVVLTLWENGYNFDNGPLQSYDDPRCAQLMANIDRGQLPTNLLPYDAGDPGPVHLSVIDKRGEKYAESLKLFGGKGHKLGSPTPVLSTSGPISNDNNLSNSELGTETSAISEHSSASNDDIIFDDEEGDGDSDDMEYSFMPHSVPVNSAFGGEGHVLEGNSVGRAAAMSGTSQAIPKVFTINGPTDFSNGAEKTNILKLRLPDGKILQLTVSSTSTIGQVREYITQSISALSAVEFVVQSAYPRRDLNDSESVTSSDIANSLLVLRVTS